jgi:hypothetical protein
MNPRRKAKRRWLTLEEFDIFVGVPCETCANWDLEEEVCKVGRRPRLYYLEDGPNERCHGVKYCMKFVRFKETATDGVKQSVAMALDCNSQKYC